MYLQPVLNLLNAGGPLLGGGVGSFVSTWVTSNPGTSNNDQITLPLTAVGTYDFDVDWGDGSPVDTITAFNDPAVTHTFTGGAGTYTVTITGIIDGWRFNNGGDRQKITEVSSWGVLKLGDESGQFYGCTNLVVTATDAPDASTSTDLASLFRDCSSITTLPGGPAKNTSAVTNMDRMFQDCSVTSINFAGFDTSSCDDMNGMFRDSGVVSLDLTSFDVSNVTVTNSMFAGCSSMTTLDVSNWVTTSLELMQSMFFDCSSLPALDVTSFNTSLVTDFAGAFRGLTGISSLDVSGFDTSSGLNLSSMFRDANVTTLALDAAGWDIDQVTSLASLCLGVTLNTANYDSILAAWAAQSPVISGLTCDFGGSVYTIATAQADRDTLTNAPNNWTITDGGGV